MSISNIEIESLNLAYKFHHGQTRKYTNEPYITHPISVAGILKEHGVNDHILISAALLHDVIENTCATYDYIRSALGSPLIPDFVMELTDISKPEDGNRKERKRIDREHTAKTSPEAKTIKLADLIHNTQSIVQYDKGFAEVYLKEKALLLPLLKEGNGSLWSRARIQLEKSLEEINKA